MELTSLNHGGRKYLPSSKAYMTAVGCSELETRVSMMLTEISSLKNENESLKRMIKKNEESFHNQANIKAEGANNLMEIDEIKFMIGKLRSDMRQENKRLRMNLGD